MFWLVKRMNREGNDGVYILLNGEHTEKTESNDAALGHLRLNCNAVLGMCP